jgi:hypothetical protein
MRHCHSRIFASRLEVTGMNCGFQLRDSLQDMKTPGRDVRKW